MKLGAYLAALSAIACCSAFAEEPQPPGAQPAAAQPPAAQAAAPAAATQPAAAQTAVAPAVAGQAEAKTAKLEKSDVTDAQIKQMRGRGYKPVKQHDGSLTFCRAEGQIGTHFEVTHCNTFDELNRMELNAKDYTNTVQQQGSAVPFKGP
jgi:hypothetical protein